MADGNEYNLRSKTNPSLQSQREMASTSVSHTSNLSGTSSEKAQSRKSAPRSNQSSKSSRSIVSVRSKRKTIELEATSQLLTLEEEEEDLASKVKSAEEDLQIQEGILEQFLKSIEDQPEKDEAVRQIQKRDVSKLQQKIKDKLTEINKLRLAKENRMKFIQKKRDYILEKRKHQNTLIDEELEQNLSDEEDECQRRKLDADLILQQELDAKARQEELNRKVAQRIIALDKADQLRKELEKAEDEVRVSENEYLALKRFDNIEINPAQSYKNEQAASHSTETGLKETTAANFQNREVLKTIATKQETSDLTKFLTRQAYGKQLPKFSGKAEEWTVFFEDFKRSTDDCGYTNSDNIGRLRQCLEGEAKKYVNSLMVSPDNIPLIIKRLKTRFGQPESIIRSMIAKAKGIPTFDADQLDKIVEFGTAVTDIIATITTLQRVDHLNNPQLLEEMELKLPRSLFMQWKRWIGGNSTRTHSLVSFGDWIDEEVEIACSGLSMMTIQKVDQKKVSFNNPMPTRMNHDIPTGALLLAGTTKLICLFCENGHPSKDCVAAQFMSYEQKQEKVKQSRNCFRCLKPGHLARFCTEIVRCNVCGWKHQVVLCPEVQQRVNTERKEKGHEVLPNRQQSALRRSPIPSYQERNRTYPPPSHPYKNYNSEIREPNRAPAQIEDKPPKREFVNHNSNNVTDFQCQAPPQTSDFVPRNNPSQRSFTNKASTDPHRTRMSRQNVDAGVLLGTIVVTLKNGNRQKDVRLVFDNGNMQSAILKSTAKSMNFPEVGTEWRKSVLYGGVITPPRKYIKFDVCIEKLDGTGSRQLMLTDEQKICEPLPRVPLGPWIDEFKQNDVRFFDIQSDREEIEILIGNDYYQDLVTGRRVSLSCGLTAVETVFGWTLNGKVPNIHTTNEVRHYCSNARTFISMFLHEPSIQDLWELETIGIRDPSEKKSKLELDIETKKHFNDTVRRSKEGRYSVSLPWANGPQIIPNNYSVSLKRLQTATEKLKRAGMYSAYDNVFNQWEEEDIIEECPPEGQVATTCHYLPHRAVIKPESTTTPVRPVFDASCKIGRNPSLNDCLLKGPNLMELIPSVLLRFRLKIVGVISDIRKAFQMVDVRAEDQDMLRFLWWKDRNQEEVKIYRHKRVVFGVNCSPYLLAAVLEYHLKGVNSEEAEIADQLLKSLYVDNCATSVDNMEEYRRFKGWSTNKLAEAGMELRQWESGTVEGTGIGSLGSSECGLGPGCASSLQEEKEETSILGYKWNKSDDTLSCYIPDVDHLEKCTKRELLSHLQKIFDPLGFLSPIKIHPKILLQETWKRKCTWDEELPEELRSSFNEWLKDLPVLRKIQIPRHMSTGISDSSRKQELHLFCDASQTAYAAVILLRTISDKDISVKIVQCNSRVAPLQKITIPRLELMACTIGARLLDSTIEALHLKPPLQTFLWSDSMTVLAWIQRNNDWGTFVGNRVREICKLTNVKNWNHVPGIYNPADLPSRGCQPREFLESKWWEGPTWLKLPQSEWPMVQETVDEDAVAEEMKKMAPVKLLANVVKVTDAPWYMPFSTYSKNLKFVAWILRMKNNLMQLARKKMVLPLESTAREIDALSSEEFESAERWIWKLVQEDVFPEDQTKIGGITVERDDIGLYRVRTRLLNRDDHEYFIRPILVPNHHPLVTQLIIHEHQNNCHAGTQMLTSIIREKYWILQARRTIKSAIYTCFRCLRFKTQKFNTVPSALPEDRVSDGKVFQIIGVDLAGPLYIKGNVKVWVVLFTCAIYRGLNLELVTSLSTPAFLDAFSRHCERRGRPKTVFSDNGTNFVGANNAFSTLNWTKIQEKAKLQQIQWKFNPPSAAWWGGWWERFVRMVKELLRRTLGKSTLTYEKLSTLLCEIAGVINRRPITVLTDDPDDLRPLTPAMFMTDCPTTEMNEFTNARSLQHAFLEKRTLLQDLKTRFRREYLSMLVDREKEKRIRKVEVGDIVLVGADNKRRWEWPLARVIELIPGKDGHVRVAKVQTETSIITRPIPRLFPMEISTASHRQELIPKPPVNKEPDIAEEVEDAPEQETTPLEVPSVVTRSGRKVKAPDRLNM